jgi:hypothetical protein
VKCGDVENWMAFSLVTNFCLFSMKISVLTEVVLPTLISPVCDFCCFDFDQRFFLVAWTAIWMAASFLARKIVSEEMDLSFDYCCCCHHWFSEESTAWSSTAMEVHRGQVCGLSLSHNRHRNFDVALEGAWSPSW